MRKAYSLAYSSISHGGELIIMLIMMVLLCKFILFKLSTKKAS